MKNSEIATRRFAALAMTKLLIALSIICLLSTPSFAEFYRYNIDELARKAKARLQEIEKKIWEEQAADKLAEISANLKTMYDQAEALFHERRYEEALAIYKKIDRMSRDPKVTRWLDKEKLFK